MTGRPSPLAKRFLLQLLIAACTTTLIGLLTFDVLSRWLVIPLIAAVVAIFMYFKISWDYYTHHRETSPRKRMPADVAAIKRAALHHIKDMSNEQAYNFIKCVRLPHKVVERITESVQIQTRTLQVTTSTTFRARREHYPSGVCTMPIDYISRGFLVDGVKIFDASEQRISSYSRNEAAGFILAALKKYLEDLSPNTLSSFEAELVSEPGPSSGAAQQIALEDAVIKVIGSDRPFQKTDLQDLTDHILLLPCFPARKRALRDCAAVIREIGSHYPILAALPMPSGSRKVVQLRCKVIKRTIPFGHDPNLAQLKSSLLDRAVDWFKNSTRRVLGVRPALVFYPLANSRRAPSYHIEIKGPEGTFLGRQRVVEQPNNKEKDLSNYRCAMQPRYGQSHSHFYVHGAVDFRNAFFENHFFERVPGSVGRATVTSLASMVLIILCALNKLDIGYVKGTDLLAVLLALPAIAAAWAGLGQVDRITGESLVARVSQIETLVASLVTAWMFAVLPGLTAETENHAFSFRTVATADWGWVWIVLVLTHLAALVAIAMCWFFRSSVQEHFIRRERDLRT